MKRSRRGPGRPPQPDAEYRRVADALRGRLVSGAWPPGTTLPSLRALAAEFGVGLDTARAAVGLLRQESRVGVSGWKRLVATPQMARKPGMEPARAVLLAVTTPFRMPPGTSDFNQLLLGLHRGAGELDAPMLVAHSYTLRTAPPHALLQLGPRALLLVGVVEPEGFLAYAKLPLPVVLVDRPAAGRPFHAIAADNEDAMRQAVRRLAALGHRRIAFVRRLSFAERGVDPDSRERHDGFRKALKEAGLPYIAEAVFPYFTRDTSASPAFRAILAPARKITAAVCADEASAVLLLEAARAEGKAVPRDLSIVCVQGRTADHRISGPAVDFFELGRRAMQMSLLPGRPVQCQRVSAAWREGNTAGPAPQGRPAPRPA
ncbi:MAG: substrate-binding domain-containing protein [Planctomycetota bacterium]|nr:substrate-binding domain-containing protein [Planctomycetota bacterium]